MRRSRFSAKIRPMDKKQIPGHFSALGASVVWATTYSSTTILLRSFSPVEILFMRFVLGFLLLCILAPKRIRGLSARQEGLYALCGLTGVTMYYLLENIALTYSTAANVGVIIGTVPFFTVLVGKIVHPRMRLSRFFFLGFIIAMIGISVISFQGEKLAFHLQGDLLALGAAFVWGIYSNLMAKVSEYPYHTLQNTRKIFFYGILFMIPIMPLLHFSPDPRSIIRPVNLGNLLYLGFLACAICFVIWNFAVKTLGPIRSSVYIYLGPALSVISAAIILGEQLTAASIAGTALTILGLVLSELSPKKNT